MIADVDTIATQRFDGSLAVLEADVDRVESVRCNFTSLQPAGHSRGHAWRSLRMTPNGKHAMVQTGSDCNWASDCLPSDSNMHTLLLMVDVSTGTITTAGKGIRNAVGMYFDRKGNFLWIDNGSDDGEGMPGAPEGGNGEHGNRPDGELNVLYAADITRALQLAGEAHNV